MGERSTFNMGCMKRKKFVVEECPSQVLRRGRGGKEKKKRKKKKEKKKHCSEIRAL